MSSTSCSSASNVTTSVRWAATASTRNGLESELSVRVPHKEDIIFIIKYLIELVNSRPMSMTSTT